MVDTEVKIPQFLVPQTLVPRFIPHRVPSPRERVLSVYFEGHTPLGQRDTFKIPYTGQLKPRNVGILALRKYGYDTLDVHATPQFEVINGHNNIKFSLSEKDKAKSIPVDVYKFTVRLVWSEAYRGLMYAIETKDRATIFNAMDVVLFGKVVNQNGRYHPKQSEEFRTQLHHLPPYCRLVFQQAFTALGSHLKIA